MDPVQRLLAMAQRERGKRQPTPPHPPAHHPALLSAEDAAQRHPRAQQSLVEAVRAGRALNQAARAELAWFARLGMTETQALTYLLRKYPAAR